MESNYDFDQNGQDDEWFVINPAGSLTSPKNVEGVQIPSEDEDDCDVGEDDSIASISVSLFVIYLFKSFVQTSKPKKSSFILPKGYSIFNGAKKALSRSSSQIKEKPNKVLKEIPKPRPKECKGRNPFKMTKLKPKTLRVPTINFDKVTDSFQVFRSNIY